MSPQIIQLIVFAAIAIFVIFNLISSLGKYNEDDPTRSKSYFGEKPKIKEVIEIEGNSKKIIKLPEYTNVEYLLDGSNLNGIKDGLEEIDSRLNQSIDLEGFVNKSKSAFEIIIDALLKNDETTLYELVDKRFISKLKLLQIDYQNLDISEIKPLIMDVYVFGNNCFIKVSFSNTGFKENWVFTKSAKDTGKVWYLSNIERE
jgi:hypothetical protein